MPSTDEAELIEVISGDSPAAEKAIACKQLAIHGSSEAVNELAKLLPDVRLASWARIALEAIPGPNSARALRQATSELTGNLQVGTINSLGVLKDKDATALLAGLLRDPDDQVASAAAVALGHIGGAQAAESLLAELETARSGVRSAIAQGCILCAERMAGEDQRTDAVQLYSAVRNSKLPKQRILEATRGEILARGSAGVPLLIEQFHEADVDRFRLALSTARELPGGEVDRALAKQLVRLEPARSALLIRVMADRAEPENLAIILDSAQRGPVEVRAAAIESLADVGDESCLPTLFEIVVTNEDGLGNLAEQTIAKLPGENADAKVLSLLADADDDQLPALLEAIGRRRIKSASTVQKHLDHPSQPVRNAALFALGQTIEHDDLGILIARTINPQHPEEFEVARTALLAASVRMPDREACAAKLSTAFEDASSTETKVALISILGQMGGANALKTIGQAAASGNTALVDEATQWLGKWMTADAAPMLLDLASNLPEGKYQIRALRAYLRIARQIPMESVRRSEMCRQALAIATRTQEQELVLKVLEQYPSKKNLRLAKEAANRPGLAETARKFAESISERLAKEDDR